MTAAAASAACTPEDHVALKRAPREAWLVGTLPLYYTGERTVAYGVEHADCRRCEEATGERFTIGRRVECRRCTAPVDGEQLCNACNQPEEGTMLKPIASLLLLLLVAASASGCLSWTNKVTPSGGRCSDMPVVGYGKEELLQGRQIHRLRAVAATKCDSTTECLEELRKEACGQDADAIVDVFTEARGLSGIAARFTGGGR